MPRRSIIAVVTLLAALVAGCGGSSPPSLSAFKSGFAADKAQFRALGSDLGVAIQSAPSKTNTALASEFASLSSRAKQQASQLRKLSPPAKYRTQLDQLAAEFDRVAGDLHSISTAAAVNSAPGARSAGVTLGQDSLKVKTIDRSLTAALGLPSTG